MGVSVRDLSHQRRARLVEVVGDDGRASPTGTIGRVLVTTLDNHLMTLVHYEIGAYAIATDRACASERALPCIGKIIGRGVNLFVNPDGKRFANQKKLGVIPQDAGNHYSGRRLAYRLCVFPIVAAPLPAQTSFYPRHRVNSNFWWLPQK